MGRPWARRWARLAAPAVAGAVIALALFAALSLTGRSVPLPLLALVAAALAGAGTAVWRWLKYSKVEARAAAARAERARLAREMHDSLSKTLDALALGAAALPATLDEPDQAARLARTLREGSLTAARDARALIDGLRAHPGDAPLHELLRAACQEWSAGTGVPVRLRVSPVQVHPELVVDMVEIVREALRNVAVHADARLVEVTLHQRREVLLAITDDGRGVRRSGSPPLGRYGLLGMAERARLAGGRLRVMPGPAGGTSVVVSFPPGARPQPLPGAAAHPGRVLMACAATVLAAVGVLVYAAEPARRLKPRATEPTFVQTGQPVIPSATPSSTATAAPVPPASPASPRAQPTTRAPQKPVVTGACQVRYTIREQWNTGFTADISITNLGRARVDGWSLVFDFTPDQKLLSAWDATAAQNGRVVTVSDGGRKTVIEPGATISFGLQGTWREANPVPGGFTLNGTLCAKA